MITLAKTEIASIEEADNWVMSIYHAKCYLAGLIGLLGLLMVWRWFDRDEVGEWMHNTWDFTNLLAPLLFGGVFVVRVLSKLLADQQFAAWVGDNGLVSNLVASVIGGLFYFATLTETPILQALFEHGMAQDPALALRFQKKYFAPAQAGILVLQQ